jgi:hypothetical protein
MVLPLKHALENLLRARRLYSDPSLHGAERRLLPLSTGAPSIDTLAAGGFPRGEISQLHGPASSGRTALVVAAVARATREGMLAAWLDPADRLDPGSAAAAGVLLSRLLWIRGRPGEALKRCVSAASTVLASGLFDLVVLDLAGTTAWECGALPGTTWVRLHRMIEGTPTALVVVSDQAQARSPSGVSLALQASPAAWTGMPGAGRLLRTLSATAKRDYRPGAVAVFERRAGD